MAPLWHHFEDVAIDDLKVLEMVSRQGFEPWTP